MGIETKGILGNRYFGFGVSIACSESLPHIRVDIHHGAFLIISSFVIQVLLRLVSLPHESSLEEYGRLL